MNIHDSDRFVLITCRAALPRLSELLDRDAEESELVRAAAEFVITSERLIEYAKVTRWAGRN